MRTMPMLPATLFFGLAQPSFAHDQWADGEPIPAWVKVYCCSVSDAHHLRASDVHITADGYRVDGYNSPIREDKKQPSPDGSWWVFYRDYPDGTQSPVYCFFGPIQGS